MKKLFIYFTILFVFILSSSFVFNSYHNNLEAYFIGEWDETHWEYKEADNYLLKQLGYKSPKIDTNNIRYHKGETWIFKQNGALDIVQEDQSIVNATWTLKGRGNILEITDGKRTEYFDIRKKVNGELEMQYMTEIQVKEDAKLIFKQNNKV